MSDNEHEERHDAHPDRHLFLDGQTPCGVRRVLPARARSADAMLRYYSSQFDLVEVDSTYYAITQPRNAELWVQRTPEDFVFDVKALRLFTLHQTNIQVFSKDIRVAMPPSKRRSLFYGDVPHELREELWRRRVSSI